MGIPVGAITWFFTLDVVLGFCFLTPCLLLLIWFLFNKYIEEKTLQDMTDESKKIIFIIMHTQINAENMK